MKRSGAEIVVEALIAQGVDLVFGYPGGKVLALYDALDRARGRIRHVLTSHEQGAAHAADGYARASGRVGVALATSGPGATNLVTGIATAYMDSIPVVFITGNVAVSQIGTDAFQEADITGITAPITKYNWMVTDVRALEHTLREAFAHAQAGRPGPVLVDIPAEVFDQVCAYPSVAPPLAGQSVRNHDAPCAPPPCGNALGGRNSASSPAHGRGAALQANRAPAMPTAGELARAAALIDEARRPFLLIGGGVRSDEAARQVRTLAEKLRAPVSATLMGLGGLPCDHPQFVGNAGMHGGPASGLALRECDLLIAVGTRFNDRILGDANQLLAHTRLLHIDIDRAEINKNLLACHPLVGDSGAVLAALNARVADKPEAEVWLRRVAARAGAACAAGNGSAQTEHIDIDPPSPLEDGAGRAESICPQATPARSPEPPAPPPASLPPRDAVRAIHRAFGNRVRVVTDVGQHQMWVAQYFPFQSPGQLITSGGLGTMGYGLGAAIGAKLAAPDLPVVLCTGDGSFRMNCNELATVQAYRLGLVIVVFNNGSLGMVRQWQTLFYDGRHACSSLCDRGPDFVKLAEAYNLTGLRAGTVAELDSALQTARALAAANRSTVIDCRIDRDEMVRPMAAPGGAAGEVLLE